MSEVGASSLAHGVFGSCGVLRCNSARPACDACIRSARFKHRPVDQVVCQYGDGDEASMTLAEMIKYEALRELHQNEAEPYQPQSQSFSQRLVHALDLC